MINYFQHFKIPHDNAVFVRALTRRKQKVCLTQAQLL